MQLRSTEFSNGGTLPERFAAEHGNISPPFQWSQAPINAQSFALVCEDPDAPKGTFMHWEIYNIPLDIQSLPENGSLTLANSAEICQGVNDAGTVGYFGPRPPYNENHHYRFRLLAMDKKLNVPAGLPGKELLEKLKPHVIAETDITATYRRGS